MSANIGFQEFRLRLEVGDCEECKDIPSQVEIYFEVAPLVLAFNEFARNSEDDESGEPRVIARQSNSKLLAWVREYTTLLISDFREEDIEHYSITTGDNIYHVLATAPPKISF